MDLHIRLLIAAVMAAALVAWLVVRRRTRLAAANPAMGMAVRTMLLALMSVLALLALAVIIFVVVARKGG